MALPPRTSWAEFTTGFTWRQGEHLSVIAPTGWGKTTLIRELLRPETRPAPWVCVLSTKRRDPVVDQFRRLGYRTARRFEVADADVFPRVVVAPKLAGFDSIDKQAEVFRSALDSLFRQGGWVVVLDELRYIAQYLGLHREVEVMLQQGRSHGLTIVAGAQRPRHVPLTALDQPRHLFFGADNDRYNVRRLAEVGGIDSAAVARTLPRLEPHEMLYLDTEPPGAMLRVKADV